MRFTVGLASFFATVCSEKLINVSSRACYRAWRGCSRNRPDATRSPLRNWIVLKFASSSRMRSALISLIDGAFALSTSHVSLSIL